MRLSKGDTDSKSSGWPSASECIVVSGHDSWAAPLLRIALFGRHEPSAIAGLAVAAFRHLPPDSWQFVMAILSGDPDAGSVKLWSASTGVSRWALRRHMRSSGDVTPAALMRTLRGCVALALLRHEAADLRRVSKLLGEVDVRRTQRCIGKAVGAQHARGLRADTAAELLDLAIARLQAAAGSAAGKRVS